MLPPSFKTQGYKRQGYRVRLRQSLVAGLLGWLAGFLASSPAMVAVGWLDSEHEVHAFLVTTAFGLAAWGGWTLLLGFVAWMLFALPVAMLIPPPVLVRYRRLILVSTVLFTLAVVSLKMNSFRDLAASRVALRFILYMPYGAFAFFFAVTTAWWYIRGIPASALD